METIKLKDLNYKELQKIAKEKDLKHVGISKIDLIESIKKEDEEVKDEDEEVKDEDEEVKDEDETVDNSAKTFNGKAIVDINNTLTNGKSYKEVRVISGETFLVNDEEFEAGIKA